MLYNFYSIGNIYFFKKRTVYKRIGGNNSYVLSVILSGNGYFGKSSYIAALCNCISIGGSFVSKRKYVPGKVCVYTVRAGISPCVKGITVYVCKRISATRSIIPTGKHHAFVRGRYGCYMIMLSVRNVNSH